MSGADILDKTSSIFFIMGTIFGKLRLLPFALFSLVANVLSQLLYLAGYVLWFVASYLYPEQPRQEDQWYGFGQFKEQSRVSAAIGTVASILSVMAIAWPVMIIPALWLFVASNAIWSISHYHKLKNPPELEEGYSENSQTNYIGYTILTTMVSLVTAICITVSFLYPPVSLAMLIASTVLSLLLTLIGLEYLVNYNFSNTPTNKWNGTNYGNLSSELSFGNEKSMDLQIQSTIELQHDAPSYPPLFHKNTIPELSVPATPPCKITTSYLTPVEEQNELPELTISLH